jgi:hypothetical protein
MPCSDNSYTIDEAPPLRKRVHLLTSMLCAICRKFEAGEDFAVADIPNLVEWWTEHKKHDALIAELERYEKAGVPMTYEQREILREHRKNAA